MDKTKLKISEVIRQETVDLELKEVENKNQKSPIYRSDQQFHNEPFSQQILSR